MRSATLFWGKPWQHNYGKGRDCDGLEEEILDLFSDLPDRKAFKIWAPATRSGP